MAYAQRSEANHCAQPFNNPFDSHADDFQPYITPGWSKQLDLVCHTLCYSDYVIAMHAPIGGGKSTFLALLQQRLDKRAQFCCLQGEEHLGEHALLRAIIEALYLPAPEHCASTEQYFDYIYKYMEESRYTGVSYVLTLEHADHLRPKVLSMLLLLAAKLRDQKGCMLHLLLFGEERLVRQLKETLGEDNWQDALYCCKLKAFSEVEVQLYLDDKLRRLPEAFAFSERDIDLVLKGAVGLPGRINQISRQLVQQKVPQSVRSRRGYRNWALLFSGLVLVSVVMTYIMNQPEQPQASQQTRSKTTAQLKGTEVSVPLVLPGKNSS